MKIFLTGASGFIGKNFCDLALKKGHYIFAPTRKKNLTKKKNLKWLKGDFDKNWKNELSKSDLLIHFAASGLDQTSLENVFDVNVFKSLRLLKNAIQNNCRKWIIISTSSEYGPRNNKKFNKFSKNTNRIPDTIYGLSKAIFVDKAINLAKKYKCKVRVMRLFAIYGKGENRNRLYPSLLNKNKKILHIKNPFETRDFTNVNFASKIILDSCRFDKNKFKYYQIWHVSENKPKMIQEFVKDVLKLRKIKKKIKLNKNNIVKFNHISDRNSVWKIN